VNFRPLDHGAKVSSAGIRLTRPVARKIRDARECPKDWSPLRKEVRHSHHRSVEVDVCPTCQGIFLDKKEIRTLTGSSSLNQLLTKYLGLDSDSQLVCPNCGGLMDGEDAGDIRVDVCLDCKGVWLDAGELERLGAMDDAEFRSFTPDKIEEILKAKDLKAEEHRKAIRTLF
jgi:Zn-finger nucleic acid-binding protein